METQNSVFQEIVSSKIHEKVNNCKLQLFVILTVQLGKKKRAQRVLHVHA